MKLSIITNLKAIDLEMIITIIMTITIILIIEIMKILVSTCDSRSNSIIIFANTYHYVLSLLRLLLLLL